MTQMVLSKLGMDGTDGFIKARNGWYWWFIKARNEWFRWFYQS